MTAPPSLDIAFEAIKTRIATQNAQITALDGKANFSLASATILTAVVTGLKGIVTPVQQAGQVRDFFILGWTIHLSTITNWLAILSATMYAIIVFTAYKAYQVRDFYVVPEPQPFLDKYLQQSEEETKEVLTGTLATVFHKNKELVEDKVFWVTWVLRSLLIEALLLLALTIAQLIA